jgi:hypothetical protein
LNPNGWEGIGPNWREHFVECCERLQPGFCIRSPQPRGTVLPLTHLILLVGSGHERSGDLSVGLPAEIVDRDALVGLVVLTGIQYIFDLVTDVFFRFAWSEFSYPQILRLYKMQRILLIASVRNMIRREYPSMAPQITNPYGLMSL